MKLKLLVLCTGNSCRSQMAEGYLRHFAGDAMEIYSAGIEAHGLNPHAVEVMREDGLDISGHSSKLLSSLQHLSFDYVITVCDHARENCPWYPGSAKKLHHDFPDPARARGDAGEIKAAFIHTRDLIRAYCRELVQKIRSGAI